ncbi:MAG: formate dehydrogenase accessory sulfurtransferase FdhD [Sphingomonadaceae bacterium]
MSATREDAVVRLTPQGGASATRNLAIEAPIAIEYNGIGYAVMMATPADLDDFAIGFTLSERLVADAGEILAIEAIERDDGRVLRITLADHALAPVVDRARQRVSESSCGLCGLESLEQVLRPLPRITTRPGAKRDALFRALAALDGHQPMNTATGAVHGAAFCNNDGAIVQVREDVGRHNALDKLIGALARGGTDPATGFFLLTARCSYELVEKSITAGCPLLVTISAPTTLAADRARAHGLTLVALARRDAMLVVSDPWGCF